MSINIRSQLFKASSYRIHSGFLSSHLTCLLLLKIIIHSRILIIHSLASQTSSSDLWSTGSCSLHHGSDSVECLDLGITLSQLYVFNVVEKLLSRHGKWGFKRHGGRYKSI